MKKILPIIIVTLLLLLSLIGNVYFFNINRILNKSVATGIFDLESVQNDLTTKTTELTKANAKNLELETSISDLTTEFDKIQADYDSLIKVEDEAFEKMDATMYVTEEKGCQAHKGTSEDYIGVGSLSFAQEVNVTGQSIETKWYQIKLSDGTLAYVSNNYLSLKRPTRQTKVVEQQPAAPGVPSTPAMPDMSGLGGSFGVDTLIDGGQYDTSGISGGMEDVIIY